jgi:hypothetical protein
VVWEAKAESGAKIVLLPARLAAIDRENRRGPIPDNTEYKMPRCRLNERARTSSAGRGDRHCDKPSGEAVIRKDNKPWWGSFPAD